MHPDVRYATLGMFTTFSVLPLAYSRDAYMHLTLNTSNDGVLLKDVPFDGYKSEFHI